MPLTPPAQQARPSTLQEPSASLSPPVKEPSPALWELVPPQTEVKVETLYQ